MRYLPALRTLRQIAPAANMPRHLSRFRQPLCAFADSVYAITRFSPLFFRC
jgi:hypothetical protein